LLDAPDADVLRRAIVNAYAEHQRGAPDRTRATVNPWNGELRDPAVLDFLGKRYNEEHCWSASQLELYTTLPFAFLLERVLDLKEITEAEEDTDPMTKGSVAHAVLERFYREHTDRKPPAYDNTVVQRLVDLAAEVITEWQQSGAWLGVQALWEQRRLGVVEMLSKFLEWDLKQLATGRGVAGQVWRCEHEFGDGIELTGVDVRGQTRRMLLRGKIDRIDNRNGVLVVIDYKSGSTPQGQTGYEDGAVLQGPLYMAALQAQGHNARKALYRSIKGQKNGAELLIGDDACERALSIAFSIPERVRCGLFEAVIAKSAKWKDYHPDLAVRRTMAQVAEGSRFDG
jgi:ATP-dependent helicase/DNAse subunit B